MARRAGGREVRRDRNPMNPTDITVTKMSLPSLDEYRAYLEAIWEHGWVTNHGPLAGVLEERLRGILASEHVLFVANGTLAVRIARDQAADENGIEHAETAQGQGMDAPKRLRRPEFKCYCQLRLDRGQRRCRG